MKVSDMAAGFLAGFALTGMALGKKMHEACEMGPGMVGKLMMLEKIKHLKRKDHMDMLTEKLESELKLTDEQVLAMKKIGFELKKKMIDAKAEIEMKKIDIGLMMLGSDVDVQAVQSEIQKAANIFVQKMVDHINAYEQFKCLLDCDQQEKLDALKIKKFDKLMTKGLKYGTSCCGM